MVLAHDITHGLRTQDVKISEDVTFDTMLLAPNTLDGLTNSGFYKPSPIQLHGIPLGKCGFDLLLEAKSGTGKTAVFTIIALEKLATDKGLQTLILAPTREIAYQISDVIKQIGSKYENINVEVIIGGLSIQEDIAKFKTPVQIVVGTPGRLRHLIQAKHIDVSAVRLLVLDEADKLMDKSFQADINYIFAVLPKEKQVIMSSATYPEKLKTVMKKYIQNAQHICPDSTSILLGIKQFISTVKCNSNIVKQTQYRFEELLKILSKKQFKQCLIFCNYQVRVRDLCKMLMREKWPAEQLHGQQEQTDRLDALKTLQEYKCRILVSTDLAARGIDASNVDLVINFEPPFEWQVYLHRIGRAGRFGSYGIAVTILSAGDEEHKFKKVMTAINGHLDLRNLWDEEKIVLNYADSSSEIQSKDEYSDLLNKLTSNVQCDKVIENLEILCDLSDTPQESQIESFDELITNFESHELSIVNSSPNLNVEYNSENTISKNYVDTHVSPKMNTNKALEENSSPISNNIIGADTSPISTNSNETSRSEPGLADAIECNKIDDVSIKQLVNLDDVLDLESDACHKALLAAGLPTSFSSSKDQRKAKKMQSRISVNSYGKQKHDLSLQKAPESEKVSLSQLSRLEHDQSNLQNNRRESNLPRRYINKDIIGKDKTKSQRKFEEIDDCGSQIYTHNEDINYDKKYDTWYRQLKTHIQQVQMALYIQELSEM